MEQNAISSQWGASRELLLMDAEAACRAARHSRMPQCIPDMSVPEVVGITFHNIRTVPICASESGPLSLKRVSHNQPPHNAIRCGLAHFHPKQYATVAPASQKSGVLIQLLLSQTFLARSDGRSELYSGLLHPPAGVQRAWQNSRCYLIDRTWSRSLTRDKLTIAALG